MKKLLALLKSTEHSAIIWQELVTTHFAETVFISDLFDLQLIQIELMFYSVKSIYLAR